MSKFFDKHIFICTSGKTCPHKAPVEDMVSFFRKELKERGLNKKIRTNKSGCLDWCDHGPVMVVYPEGVWYTDLQMENLPRILDEHILGDKPVEELMYKKDK